MKTFRIIATIFLCFVLLLSSSVNSFAQTTSGISVNGDINGDNIVSTDDVIIALQIATNVIEPTQTQIENGDINRDGFVTSGDALLILKVCSGQEESPSHIYTPWEIKSEPTCIMNGVATCKCIECSQTFRMHIPALGHNYEDNICTLCGDIYAEQKLIYNNKQILFGYDSATVQKVLGKPQDILTDGDFLIYVYCQDYGDLGIFTFVNDKLSQFYSNNLSSGVYYGQKSFYLSNIYNYSESMVYRELGTIKITAYVDTLNQSGEYAYAFLATSDDYYNFSSSVNYKVHEKLNFHLLNGCRAIHNVSPVKYCETARIAAYNHSLDMATKNYFSHENKEGLSVQHRLENAGIQNWHYCAENIAAGMTDAYWANNGWYNSASHRSAMLDSIYEYVGIGIAYNQNSDYKYYATQNYYTLF